MAEAAKIMTQQEILDLQLELRNGKRHKEARKEVKDAVKKIKGLDHSKDKESVIELDEYTENLRR